MYSKILISFKPSEEVSKRLKITATITLVGTVLEMDI